MTTYSYVIQPDLPTLIIVTTGGTNANNAAMVEIYASAWAAAEPARGHGSYVPRSGSLPPPPDPVITGGANANSKALGEVYGAWVPDPAAYYFMGQGGPYLPNVLAIIPGTPPDIFYKTEYNREQRPWDSWWVPPDPLPTLTWHALQPAIPIGGLGSAQANLGVYASFPADVSTITWVQLDPELISPPTPPPPLPVLPALAQVQRQWDQWWVAPDPLPTLPQQHFRQFVQRLLFVPRAELYAALLSPEIKPTILTSSTLIRPQPYHPAGPPHYETVVAAWAAPDPQPPTSPFLPAQLVTLPYIPPRQQDVVDIASTWAAEAAPFAQRLARLIRGVVPGAAVFAKTNAGIAIGAWAPEPVVPQPRKLLITLPQVVPARRETSEVILSAWEPASAPVQGQLARLAQVPVPEIVLAQINSAIAVGAWGAVDAIPQTKQPTAAITTIGWQQVPSGAQNAIVALWQDVPVQPIRPSILPISMTAVVVNNPPLIGTSLDNLYEIIGVWAPSLFDAWFTSQPMVNPGTTTTPPHHKRHERSPYELGSTLRAGLGSLSR